MDHGHSGAHLKVNSTAVVLMTSFTGCLGVTHQCIQGQICVPLQPGPVSISRAAMFGLVPILRAPYKIMLLGVIH